MDKSSNKKVLEVKNLFVRFGDDLIIDNLSFDVAKGEHLTIIGPNGSGKTTLFRALIDTIPHQGEVIWALDTIIGYIPQKLDIERNVPLSLYDFLQSKNSGLKGIGDGEIKDCLKLVNLPEDILGKPLGALSGGQFQRALVTFALIGSPTVLLFDEPTAGIDQPSEEQIYDTLHRLQDERGVTIITISHDLSLVHRHAHKVLCLNRRKICYGLPEEVLDKQTLSRLYGTEHHKFFHHIHDK
ncbi:MAG: metal ABC transporter ATP-binding protein [Candidatus Liptonbacteria bacterium]|nr:metal ABC transporter ATP-binding protein [Candidatus Liptonbacteria bacterium]